MCSGSGMDADVMYTLMDDLRARGVNTLFENVMMSEIVPSKQAWLLKQEAERCRRSGQKTSPCLYVDVKDISKGCAPCCAHDPRTRAQNKGKYAACRVRTACGSSCAGCKPDAGSARTAHPRRLQRPRRARRLRGRQRADRRGARNVAAEA